MNASPTPNHAVASSQFEAPGATACPACGSKRTRSFYQCSGVPVHSCLLVDDQRTAVEFPRGELDLVFCAGCGFVYNQLFDPSHNAYSSDYEETQGFSPLFREFIGAARSRWPKVP
jgi:hypothetical protein